MEYLQAALLILAAIVATAVVLTWDPRDQVLVSGFYGLVLTLLFFAVQSADVALSELAVSTIAVPALTIMALRKVRLQTQEGDPPGRDNGTEERPT